MGARLILAYLAVAMVADLGVTRLLHWVGHTPAEAPGTAQTPTRHEESARMSLILEQTHELERLLERATLRDVINHMAVICHERADRHNAVWSNPVGAEYWRRAARALERLSIRDEITEVSK